MRKSLTVPYKMDTLKKVHLIGYFVYNEKKDVERKCDEEKITDEERTSTAKMESKCN